MLWERIHQVSCSPLLLSVPDLDRGRGKKETLSRILSVNRSVSSQPDQREFTYRTNTRCLAEMNRTTKGLRLLNNETPQRQKQREHIFPREQG